MAAVRPEFRAEVLVFAAADPVFSSGLCLVDGCGLAVHAAGMCGGHPAVEKAGRPDPGQLPAAVTAPWLGRGPLPSGRCLVTGCGFGVARRGLCRRHARRWRSAGQPDPGGGLPPSRRSGTRRHRPARSATAKSGRIRAPRSAGPTAAAGRRHGCPDPAEFARECEAPRDVRPRADLSPLPRQLKLELQYALQRRRDDSAARARPATSGP